MEENKKKKDIDFLDKTYLKISNALNDEEKTRKSLFSIFITALTIIASIFLIELTLVVCFYDIDKLGAFGDFFGGMINPLLTFCTFMALLMTIILQQKELSLTREELSETKQATKDSAQALIEQSNSIKLQNFENTFFNMLDLHNEILSSLSLIVLKKYFIDKNNNAIINDQSTKEEDRLYFYTILEKSLSIEENRDYNGKKAISKLFEIVDKYISNNKDKHISSLYNDFYKEYNEIVGHYFRNIYQILKFINKNVNKNIDNKFYSNILRAQLSNTELALLFINSLSKQGEKMFPLLVKYNFMEPLPIKIIDNKYLKKMIQSYIIQINNLNRKSEKKYTKWEVFGDSREWKAYIVKIFQR